MKNVQTNILCLSPWIHDFAAYNLWNAPLGLYRVASALSAEIEADFDFLDLTDAPIKQKPDGRSHIERSIIAKPVPLKNIPRHFCRYGISPIEAEEKIKGLISKNGRPFDAVLVTSLMGYWYTGVTESIALVKRLLPKAPVVLGGIYATLFAEHARKTTGADHVFEGPAVDPESVEKIIGLLEKSGVEILRKRSAQKHWSEFDAVKIYAPLTTGEGCPMKCSYCASHILSPRFSQREAHDVISEMQTLHKKGARNFAFYDDALLINAEKVAAKIFESVAEKMPDVKLFTPVGVQSRFITPELAKLMHRAKLGHMRLGFETSDLLRQANTGGKTTNDELECAFRNLVRAGYAQKDVGVFIMHGLPDQPIEEVEAAVAFAKKLGARIALTEYSPIPHTAESNKVPHEVFDEPLLTNNTAYSLLFGKYDPLRLERLHLSAKD